MEKKTLIIEKGKRPLSAIDGRQIYNNYCYFCHGYQGDANTVAGIYLTPPPRDFTKRTLSKESMLQSVREGKPNTAMMAFKKRLSMQQINAVVTYIQTAFMPSLVAKKEKNTAYHIPENGWYNHEKYREAYPFALSELSINVPVDALTEGQKKGRKMYLSSCITCHEQKESAALVFETRPVSAPRFGYSPRNKKQSLDLDTQTGATPYAKHDQVPKTGILNRQEHEGEKLFQKNCAFCHAADGTGKGWIGQFIEPHARDLTALPLAQRLTPNALRQTIENGLPNTTMSAWKNVLTAEQIDAVVAYVEKVFLHMRYGAVQHKVPSDFDR